VIIVIGGGGGAIAPDVPSLPFRSAAHEKFRNYYLD